MTHVRDILSTVGDGQDGAGKYHDKYDGMS